MLLMGIRKAPMNTGMMHWQNCWYGILEKEVTNFTFKKMISSPTFRVHETAINFNKRSESVTVIVEKFGRITAENVKK